MSDTINLDLVRKLAASTMPNPSTKEEDGDTIQFEPDPALVESLDGMGPEVDEIPPETGPYDTIVDLVNRVDIEHLKTAVTFWSRGMEIADQNKTPVQMDPQIFQQFNMLSNSFISQMKLNIPIYAFNDITIFGMFMFTVGRLVERLTERA